MLCCPSEIIISLHHLNFCVRSVSMIAYIYTIELMKKLVVNFSFCFKYKSNLPVSFVLFVYL